MTDAHVKSGCEDKKKGTEISHEHSKTSDAAAMVQAGGASGILARLPLNLISVNDVVECTTVCQGEQCGVTVRPKSATPSPVLHAHGVDGGVGYLSL